MRTIRLSGIIILILIVSAGVSFIGTDSEQEIAMQAASESHTYAALIDHAPFSIDNDTHMESYASLDGWTGDGSADDPFLIDFYNFTTSGNAIEIKNVTHHFVIGNCSFQTPTISVGVGIKIYNSSNGLIGDCNFTELETGVILQALSGFRVESNDIASERMGILLENSSSCEISNSDIKRGVSIHGDEAKHWQHQISNINIQGSPLGYFFQYDGIIDGGMYSQFILAECDGAMIRYGMDDTIRVHTRIQLGFCDNIQIEEVNVYPSEIGIYAQSTNNTHLYFVSTWGDVYGVQLVNCHYWDFDHTHLCGTGVSGLYSLYSHNNKLRNSYLYQNNRAITLIYSNDTVIRGCDIYDNEYGITIENGGFHEISFNKIYQNAIAGLRLDESSSNSTIWANEFYENGLDAEDDSNNCWDDGVFMGNSYKNYSGPGVYDIPGMGGGIDHYPINYYDYTGPIEVFLPPSFSYEAGTTGNYFELYFLSETRYDFEIRVDGIGHGGGGNHDWPYQSFIMDGFSEGTHLIEVNAEDRLGNFIYENMTLEVIVVDTTVPGIDGPSSIVMIEASEETISYALHDIHPWQYTVYRNGSVYREGAWNYSGETIQILLHTWESGVYNVTIEAADSFGNNATAETLVVIFPLIIIDDPDNLVYVEGEVGNVLNWSILVGEPDYYEIYRNGSLYAEGPVDSSNILCNVDNLAVGTYNFTLVLYEGNFWIFDTAFVFVVDELPTTTISTTTPTTPTIPPPIPILPLEMIALAGVGVVVLLFIAASKKQSWSLYTD